MTNQMFDSENVTAFAIRCIKNEVLEAAARTVLAGQVTLDADPDSPCFIPFSRRI